MIPYKAHLCHSCSERILLMIDPPADRLIETCLDSLLVRVGPILCMDCGILRRVNTGTEIYLRLVTVMGVGEYISPAECTLAS